MDYVILSNGEYRYKIYYNKYDKVSTLLTQLKKYYQTKSNNGIVLIYGTTALDENKRIMDYNITSGKRIKFSDAYDGGLNNEI